MEVTTARERFRSLSGRMSAEEYNYDHFRLPVLADQARRTLGRTGIEPGEMAPDFELPRAGGGTVRLSELSGTPILLRFGSPSCPVTVGTIDSFKALHSRWGDRVQFVEVVVRQAHPGPRVPAHTTDEEKEEEALHYKLEDDLPWIVAADDVEGTTHQVYGAMAAPVYLLDSEGRVAWYSVWPNAKILDRAIEELLERGGAGVVEPGISRAPDLKGIVTQGWPAIKRGLPQSLIDLETAAPSVGLLLWGGYHVHKAIGHREKLPVATRAAFAIGAVAVGIGVLFALQRRSA